MASSMTAFSRSSKTKIVLIYKHMFARFHDLVKKTIMQVCHALSRIYLTFRYLPTPCFVVCLSLGSTALTTISY